MLYGSKTLKTNSLAGDDYTRILFFGRWKNIENNSKNFDEKFSSKISKFSKILKCEKNDENSKFWKFLGPTNFSPKIRKCVFSKFFSRLEISESSKFRNPGFQKVENFGNFNFFSICFQNILIGQKIKYLWGHPPSNCSFLRS